MTLTRKDLWLLGLGAAALTAVALWAANFAGTGNGGIPEYAITLGGSVLVAGALFGWVIPRSERPARAGVLAGVAALASVAVFWTGLPFVLGPAAAALGLRGRTQGGPRGQVLAAVVTGALATLAGLAVLVADLAS